MSKSAFSRVSHGIGQGVASWFAPLRWRDAPSPRISRERPPQTEDSEFRQIAFTFAVIALAAKLSQADGQVTREEALAFRQLFRVSKEDYPKIHRLFAQACAEARKPEYYATQVAQLFPGQTRLFSELLDRLFKIAVSDRSLQAAEVDFLKRVARCLGISAAEFRRVQGIYTASPSKDPYGVLGLSPRSSDEALKQAFRSLIRENHPDILSARGAPPDVVARAGGRVAELNHAYDRILRKRGLK